MFNIFKIFRKKPEIDIQVRNKGFVDIKDDNSFFAEHKTFIDEDFSNQKISHFSSHNCEFKNCNFKNVVFEQACFGSGMTDSFYENCIFDGSDITAIDPGKARFVNCSFRDINIYTFIGMNIEMINCYFSGVIHKSFFNGSDPTYDGKSEQRIENEFYGNDFSNCQLIDFVFRSGIDLSKQKLPDGWENPIEPEFNP